MKIAIITENWLPKVDGVTRTLARLLEHLQAEGHQAILLGPESGMETYAGAELVGTAGIPFLPYPELKLNLWRPLFEMLKKQDFNNLCLWPRGVDISLFSPQRRSSELRAQWMGLTEEEANVRSVILYVGRVSFEKNLGLVIQSYKRMDHNKCHLVIVGHGPAFDEIQTELAASGTPVTFTGYLQGVDLATAYASADIFAFPSFTETFGQVVLESMASGLPVVGLNAEGVCDLVTHEKTGLLLDVGDMSREEQIEGYQHNLERLIDNVALRQVMGRDAIASSRKYTWYEAMEKIVQGYREVVAKKENEMIKDSDSGVEEDFEDLEAEAEDEEEFEGPSSAPARITERVPLMSST
ncbi:unnamed protein product [Umbelopsis sp. WA50703]